MLDLALQGIYLVSRYLHGWSFHRLPAQPVVVLGHAYWEIFPPVPREGFLQRKLCLSPLAFLLRISAAVPPAAAQQAAPPCASSPHPPCEQTHAAAGPSFATHRAAAGDYAEQGEQASFSVCTAQEASSFLHSP